MTQPSLAQNPFMLMLDPEVVLAAMQRSETLEQLSRRICHPLDRPVPTGPTAANSGTGRPVPGDDD